MVKQNNAQQWPKTTAERGGTRMHSIEFNGLSGCSINMQKHFT